MPDPKNDDLKSLGLEGYAAAPDNLGLEGFQNPEQIQGDMQGHVNSQLGDMANLAPAGATFGFDDDIAGAVGGVGAVLKGQPFAKGYAEAKANRQLSKAESAANSPLAPVGYGIGALASGQALTKLGAAIPGAVGKGIQMLGGGAKAAEGAGLGTRAAVGAGNLAVPGAVAGAGEANSLEEVPEEALKGAAISTAVGGALKIPGAIRSKVAKLGPWAQRGADKTTLASTGAEGKVLEDIAREPGGHRQRVDTLQRLGIGGGVWPTASKTVEQAENAVEQLNAQRAAIAERAGDVRIPSAENERAIRAAADVEYPSTALRGTHAKILEEAAAQGQGGTPVYAPATGQVVTGSPNALAKRGQPGPQLMQETGRERTLAEQQREISDYNSRAYNERRALDNESANVSRVAGRAMNDTAEGVLEQVEPGLGQEWRGNKLDTATALKTHDYAVGTSSKDPKLTNLARGMARGTIAMGVADGSQAMAAAGAVGEAMSYPQVRRLGYLGTQAVAGAAERAPNTALGRILSKLPGANFGAAAVRGGAMAPDVQESYEAIQRAAMENPDKAAQTHYIESETNPAYNAAVNKVPE